MPPFHHTDPIKAAYGTIGSVGILGNGVVIFVISRTPALKSRLSNKLIVHNSLVDLISSAILLGIALTVTDETIPFGGVLGTLYCMLWMSRCFLWSLLVTSTYCLQVLTFERYLGVVHPVWHKVWFTKSRVKILLTCAWVVGFVTDFTQTMPTTAVKNGKCALYTEWPAPWVRQMTGIMTFFVLYLIPLLFLIYCYGHMAFAIRQRMRKTAASAKDGGENAGAQTNKAAGQWSRAKRNVIKTLALVSLAFAICWSCNSVYFFMFSLGYPADYASDFYHFTVVAIYFNCCINPFVYIFKYDQFREAMFLHICKRQPPTSGGESSVGDTTHTNA